jgi:hypothetical protein
MARCNGYRDLRWQEEVRKTEEKNEENLFDRLPPEVIEKILFYLPLEDVLNLTAMYERFDRIVDNNRTLAYYKMSSADLLEAGRTSEDMRKIIAANNEIRKKLNRTMRIKRIVPDMRWVVPHSGRCDLSFVFHSNRPQELYRLVVEEAINVEVHPYNAVKMIVVLAHSGVQAQILLSHFVLKGFDVEIALDYLPPERVSGFREKRDKFILVTTQLHPHLTESYLPAIISLKTPANIEEHLEIHSLNPRSITSFHCTNAGSDYRVAAEIFGHMEKYRKVFGKPWAETPKLVVHRSSFTLRATQYPTDTD